jgi:hypothetical protein
MTAVRRLPAAPGVHLRLLFLLRVRILYRHYDEQKHGATLVMVRSARCGRQSGYIPKECWPLSLSSVDMFNAAPQ